MTDELKIIKDRWSEENRYRVIQYLQFEIFDKAQKDISYLLNRLEAAEKSAKGFAKMRCPNPDHYKMQVMDSYPCPKCGDTSFIPKAGE